MSSWNELGDFLAGSFSPLAFLWLVLGYLQQQEELQQNTEALRLQAAELKNSVDQYKEMVSIAREQLLADAGLIEENKKIREIETKPDIRILSLAWQSKNGIEYTYKTLVHSDEREARNVCISFPNGFGSYKEFNRELVKGLFSCLKIKLALTMFLCRLRCIFHLRVLLVKNISIAMFILMSRMGGIENQTVWS